MSEADERFRRELREGVEGVEREKRAQAGTLGRGFQQRAPRRTDYEASHLTMLGAVGLFGLGMLLFEVLPWVIRTVA